MNKKERVKACMDRQPVDRPPFAIWRHFTQTQGKECVAAHKCVFEETDTDILKIMADGFRDISENQVVSKAEDWDRIRVPQPGDAFFTQQMDRIRWSIEAIGDCAPVYHSVFSPYTLLHLAWGKELVDAHLKDPRSRKHVMPVLNALTQSLARGIENYMKAGASGLVITFTGAEEGLFTKEEHAQIIAPSDRVILETANTMRDYNILHFCAWGGRKNDLSFWKEYPGAMAQWESYIEDLPPEKGYEYFTNIRSILGGFQTSPEALLMKGTEEEIKRHTRGLVERMGTIGYMLGGGGGFPVTLRSEAIRWIGEALKESGKERRTTG